MQMYYKKRSALGVKYCQGDIITDGEAMLGGAFTAPVIQALIPGWWHWMGAQKPIPGAMFPRNEQGKIQVAQVVMSFTTHPDFELLGQGMWVLAGLSDQRLEGRSLSGDLKIPTVEEKKNPNIRTFYDNVLMSHAICHLIPGYTRPALSEINLQNVQQCIHQNLLVGYLDVLIQQNQISGQIGSLIPYAQFWYTNQQGQQFYQIVDLNLLHQSYIHQLRNELRVLNSAMPQGYVYTIDPPSIFAKTLGGAALGAGVLNRFQALAFQYLYKTEPQLFQNMKMFAFNDYVPNDNMLDHYQRNVFMQSQIKVVSKKTLFSTQNLHYNGPEGLALVIHPNGDLYGKNIQTEGYSSLEGLIGNTSNAACCLDPNFFSQADATQWATTGLMRHVARFSKAH
jgi:hypothetical protein